MSYIKIYPKNISVLPTEFGTLAGKVIFDLEQYGHLLPRQSFDIQIAHSESTNNWSILSLEDHPDIKNFDSFLRALNFYVFKNLKIEVPQLKELSRFSPFEVDLREVYFALDPESSISAPDYLWGEIN
jgi:hypothetical protein